MCTPGPCRAVKAIQLSEKMEVLLDHAVTSAAKYPNQGNKTIQYGTAGFRSKASDLSHILYRMGLFAVLRSKFKGATIGVMITASHNPEEDNGVKIIDPMGEMLAPDWENHATLLANCSNETMKDTLRDIIHLLKVEMSNDASIFIGQDTRSSSPALANAVMHGVKAFNGVYKDFGVVTTPMLHYFVFCKNTNGAYGEPTSEGYITKLSNAFKKLRMSGTKKEKYSSNIYFDGANGVGAVFMKEMQKNISDSLNIEIFNGGSGTLNHHCGADFVKVQQKPPEGVPLKKNVRCVTVDGDADRIVYYYVDEQNVFHLLDGDRIATLLASHLMDLVKATSLSIDLGLVQTAYANGNSTNYIARSLKIPVECVATGVKYLHHAAQEFDIGVYFEANGHGTMCVKKSTSDMILNAASDTSLSPDQRNAAQHLASVVDLANQTVGDAIADMLLVETVLYDRDWDVADWLATYTDLPNKLMKVEVKDRRVIKTTNAERLCVSPAGLQETIDAVCDTYESGRAFVRPSGTEDVVRVYAEADTQANADRLAVQVARAVHMMAGGVGEPPGILTENVVDVPV